MAAATLKVKKGSSTSTKKGKKRRRVRSATDTDSDPGIETPSESSSSSDSSESFTSTASSSSYSSSESSSDSSSKDEFVDAVDTTINPLERMEVALDPPAAVADMETQTAVTTPSRAEIGTGMEFTEYPKLWDDAGEIEARLQGAMTAVDMFVARMATLRSHIRCEARNCLPH